jgi:hypothetical protein
MASIPQSDRRYTAQELLDLWWKHHVDILRRLSELEAQEPPPVRLVVDPPRFRDLSGNPQREPPTEIDAYAHLFLYDRAPLVLRAFLDVLARAMPPTPDDVLGPDLGDR